MTTIHPPPPPAPRIPEVGFGTIFRRTETRSKEVFLLYRFEINFILSKS